MLQNQKTRGNILNSVSLKNQTYLSIKEFNDEAHQHIVFVKSTLSDFIVNIKLSGLVIKSLPLKFGIIGKLLTLAFLAIDQSALAAKTRFN